MLCLYIAGTKQKTKVLTSVITRSVKMILRKLNTNITSSERAEETMDTDKRNKILFSAWEIYKEAISREVTGSRNEIEFNENCFKYLDRSVEAAITFNTHAEERLDSKQQERMNRELIRNQLQNENKD